ncbi:MAG: ATP-binding protein, partial [Candidatus Peribacter sp.]|nr:ATP-binding protein [Candidatus Peribacter sp.]
MNPGSVIEVEVSEDHLQSIYANATPAKAIAEIIWNALDADATEISVEFERNKLEALDRIIIKDNGHGIDFNKLDESFRFLGSSPKKTKACSPSGRLYHGCEGKGRYYSFYLGYNVEWKITYKEKTGDMHEFVISGEKSTGHLRRFPYSDHEVSKAKVTGVEVVISNIPQAVAEKIKESELKTDIITTFAYYLKAYKKEKIVLKVDGTVLDPDSVLEATETANFEVEDEATGRKIPVNMEMYHWTTPSVHKRFFCGD